MGEFLDKRPKIRENQCVGGITPRDNFLNFFNN